MDEKTILRLAIITTIVGLTLLFLYTEELTLSVVEEIDTFSPGEFIAIHGKITKLSTHEKVVFATIEGQRTETTEMIVFTSEPVYLKEGFFVEARGRVEEYKGKKEVIASEIIVK